MISEQELDELLSRTDNLFANIYAFDLDPCSFGGASHSGCAIAHQDLNERRGDFIRELRNTMSSWVYSRARYEVLLKEALRSRGMDEQNASAHLYELVRSKFRRGFPAGQFGELLLFNILQHFFKAPPVLRKMSITTNPKIERHGADAVHFRRRGNDNIIYLGEAKTYARRNGFRPAVIDAIQSAFESYFGFQDELDLYVYDDLVADELSPIAKAIKENTLQNLVLEAVCVASYDESKGKPGKNMTEIHSVIEEIVRGRIDALEVTHESPRHAAVFGRMHFFLLPFWGLKAILEDFDR